MKTILTTLKTPNITINAEIELAALDIDDSLKPFVVAFTKGSPVTLRHVQTHQDFNALDTESSYFFIDKLSVPSKAMRELINGWVKVNNQTLNLVDIES